MRPPDPVADADALGDLFAALERRGREVLAAAHAEDRPIDLDRLQDEIDLARSRLAGFTRAATQAAFESARVSGTADLDRLSDALGRLLIKADAAVASLRRAHASRLRAGQGRIAQSLDAAGLEEAGDALRRLYLTTRSVRRITAATSTPGHLVRALRAGAAYAHHRRGCTDRPRPTRFETPPARSVMAVEGFTSSYDGANIGNLGAMLAAIGYADDRIRRFSYADHDATGRALPYAARHTTIDIAANARRLGAQLRAAHRADPNARFDLVGHSLGGVVVAYFLAYVYEAADPAYPPIESAVTINSPLQGVPLAQLAVLLGETRTAGTLLDSSAWIEDRLQAAPDSRAIAQLAETSSFIRRLADAADFGGVDLTTIATTTDWLVPAANARHDAASTNVIVDAPEAGAWHEAHSSVRRDPSAHAAIVAAVEGEPHACVTPAAYFGLRTQAAAVHRAEQIAAYQLGLAALFFDGPRARNQS